MMVYDQVKQIDGGFRLGETETHYLDAMQMLYNWRLCMTPKNCPLVIDRSWCYRGTGSMTLLAINAAVVLWMHEGGDAPIGWIKDVNTGENREGLSWQQLSERDWSTASETTAESAEEPGRSATAPPRSFPATPQTQSR